MTKAVDSTSQEDGWSTLSAVGSFLGNSQASFDPRNYGFAKLSSLVKAQDYLELQQAGEGAPTARVRLRPVAAKATTRKRVARKK